MIQYTFLNYSQTNSIMQQLELSIYNLMVTRNNTNYYNRTYNRTYNSNNIFNSDEDISSEELHINTSSSPINRTRINNRNSNTNRNS